MDEGIVQETVLEYREKSKQGTDEAAHHGGPLDVIPNADDSNDAPSRDADGPNITSTRDAVKSNNPREETKGPIQLEIVMDDRELKSPVAKILFSRGIKLSPRRLEVADFIISNQIAIERKTAPDFESSIMDGRLFSQCRDLTANFQYPLICIVGRDFGRLHKKAIMGAQISIATQFRIPVFQLESEEELADFIQILLVARSKPQKDMKLRFEKKATTKDEQLQMVIEGVQMIGPVHAKNLLKKFKTIQKVFSASEKQMQKVEGIGEIRAKQIKRIATTVYGEEDKGQEKLEAV